jgi:hypothetical protein
MTNVIAAIEEPRRQTMTIAEATARQNEAHAAMGCAKGHSTLPLPDTGGDLVRLSCGCPLATASEEALVEEFGRALAPAEREERIRAAARAGT